MGFQHLFHRHSTRKSQEKSDVTETYKTLIDARFDRLESNFNLLRTEWHDSYEKIMLLYDRSRKRLQTIQKAQDKDEPSEPTPALPQTGEDVLRRYNELNGG